jgi:hypothetical protein
MKRRTTLLAISVLTVGILIMPYTISLFADQHQWKAAADVDCLTCHSEITEPGAGYMHSSLGTGKAYCDACHQIASPGTSAGVTGSGGFDDEHASVTVECLDCHEATAGTAADVWWSTGDPMDGSGAYINITSEAHHNMTGEAGFPTGAWASPYLAGNNEACVACHTNVTVEVWFQWEAQTLNITASENVWGNWTVDFTVLP